MPDRPRNQLNLATMILWVACCAVGCWNLRILADHRDDLRRIREDWTGRLSSVVPPAAGWPGSRPITRTGEDSP